MASASPRKLVPGIARNRPILAGANQPMHRLFASWFGEQLINVSFAIGHADALDLRHFLGQPSRLPQAAEPTEAFLLFDRLLLPLA